MKLIELNPQFLKAESTSLYHDVDDIKLADGIMFLCPKCFEKNKGEIATHSVICWQPHISQDYTPKPGRWNFLGTGYNDLTLQAGSSSILLQGEGCQAHFFIHNGQIQ
jgi:hypothetical protein